MLREAVSAAAESVPGLTDLRITAEADGEVSFTAVSTAGTDLRGALSQALAAAGCPVLSLSAETMSLEDVFLQLTEAQEPAAAPEVPAAVEPTEAPDTTETQDTTEGKEGDAQ